MVILGVLFQEGKNGKYYKETVDFYVVFKTMHKLLEITVRCSVSRTCLFAIKFFVLLINKITTRLLRVPNLGFILFVRLRSVS